MKRAILILGPFVIVLLLLHELLEWKSSSNEALASSTSGDSSDTAKIQRLPKRTPQSVPIETNSSVVETGGEEQKLSAEQIEAYLLKTKRSAESLLNAFTETGETNFLAEAAQKYPDNPLVQFAMVSNLSPEDRSEWMEKFKASCPDNGLPNYLSALDEFKSGNPEKALAEIEAASEKSIDAFERERSQSREEMYLLSGYSPIHAREKAFLTLEIPQLPQMKGLAWEIDALQKQYKDAGDDVSNQKLAAVGIEVARKFLDNNRNPVFINQLVGYAMEHIALSNLDPDTYYDFLGKTAGERIREQKAAQREARDQGKAFIQNYPNLSDIEKTIFQNRWRVYGELNAMRWMNQNYGSPVTK